MFTYKQFMEFYHKYYAGEYPNERFGQAWINHMLTGQHANPEVFYMTDDKKCHKLICELYVIQ